MTIMQVQLGMAASTYCDVSEAISHSQFKRLNLDKTFPFKLTKFSLWQLHVCIQCILIILISHSTSLIFLSPVNLHSSQAPPIFCFVCFVVQDLAREPLVGSLCPAPDFKQALGIELQSSCLDSSHFNERATSQHKTFLCREVQRRVWVVAL